MIRFYVISDGGMLLICRDFLANIPLFGSGSVL